MAARKRSITRNVGYSLLGQVLPLGLAFFAIPVLISRLGTTRFGLLTIGWMILGYFSLFDLGLGRVLVKLTGEKIATNKQHEIPALFWTSLFLMSLIGLCAAALLFPFSSKIAFHFLRIPSELQAEGARTFRILSAGIPLVVISTGLQGVLEGQQNFRLVSIMRVFSAFMTFGGSWIASYFTVQIDHISLVLLAARFVYGLTCFALDLKTLPVLRSTKIDLKHLPGLMSFGGWLTVSNLVGPFMVYFDRFLIGAWISVKAVAYYVTPYEVITKSSIATAALVTVLFPAFSGYFAANRDLASEVYLKGKKVLTLAMFPVTCFVLLFGRTGLQWWLGAEFAQNSTIILQVLAIGVFINGPAQIAFVLIQAANRPDFTAKWHLVQIPIYFFLLWSLVHVWGLAGAAVAWTFRIVIDASLLFWFANRLLAIPAAIRRQYNLFIIASLVLFSIFCVFRIPLLASGLIFMVIIVVFGLICWNFLLTAEEKKLIWRPLHA